MVQINKNMHSIPNLLQALLELSQDTNKWINIPYLWNYLDTGFSRTRILTPY